LTSAQSARPSHWNEPLCPKPAACPNSRAIVLDPFAGSGSAGVAARLEGRGFIGFEKDEQTAKAANKRVGRGL